jgi:hypothetical protein
MIARIIVTAVAASLAAPCLVGCGATQAQLHALQIAGTAKTTLASYKSCLAPIEGKPEYTGIYEKIAVERTSDPAGKMPSDAQLNDQTRITEKEIATGLRWYAEAQQCSIPAMEALAQISPEFQEYFINNQREVTELLNEIVTTKPTFGKINQRLLVMKTSRKVEAARIGQGLRAALLSEHEQELQERAEVTQEILDASLSLAASLASRQAVLIRSQRAFVARHPEYASDPNIKTVRCTTINKALSCTLI